MAGSSLEALEELKKTLETKFKKDNRGKLEWFQGIQINEDFENISLEQETYIESVREKFSMQYSNPPQTPAKNNLSLMKTTEVEQLVDETIYRSLVGSLLFIAKQTRPDIVWIVDVLSRFMDKPAKSHRLNDKRALRYLQATKSLRLVYPEDSDYNLTGESDADLSGDHDDRRSTTSYFFKLGFSGGSSQLAKQETADSGSLLLRSKTSGFSCRSRRSHLLQITCLWNGQPTDASNSDWWSCIKLATNPVMHKRSKHIDTKIFFISEKVDNNSVQLVYTPPDQLAADLLTKSLPQVKVEHNRKQLFGQLQNRPPDTGTIWVRVLRKRN